MSMDAYTLHERDLGRFLPRIDRSSTFGCWPWTGSFSDTGYGQFWASGKNLGAHRVAYVIHHGPIPEGAVVMHTCDNTRCCRPDHLRAGSQSENLADARAKGRWTGRWNRRVTDEQVEDIRRRHDAGESQSALGREFGISQAQVWRIVRGLGRAV